MSIAYGAQACCETGKYQVEVKVPLRWHEATVTYQVCDSHLAEIVTGQSAGLFRVDVFEVESITIRLEPQAQGEHEAEREAQRQHYADLVAVKAGLEEI